MIIETDATNSTNALQSSEFDLVDIRFLFKEARSLPRLEFNDVEVKSCPDGQRL